MRIGAACLLALALLPGAANAGGDSASVSSPVATVEGDARTFLAGAGFILSSPARWRGADWLTFGAESAGAAASACLDVDGRLFMQRNQSPSRNGIARVAEQYGVGLNMAVLSAAGYIAGLALGDRWLRQTSFLAGSAILIAATFSTVSKIVVGRARPYVGAGHMTFRPFSFPVEHYASFPSGHTIVAFAFSGVLADRIGNGWASAGLYCLAGACGVSRMYTDEHWISDVAAGALISLAVSHALVRWYEGREAQDGETGLHIVPGVDRVMLVLSW